MVKCGLLIGINYRGTEAQLNGCINDVNNMKLFLQSQLGYTDFVMLTDDTPVKPTGINILKQIDILVRKLKSGDEAWVHFSGHGTLVRDRNRDEESGFDSCFVPIDYERAGLISDDVIRSNLVQRVPRGAKLYVVLDACHSATGCDLRHKYDDSSYNNNQKGKSPTYVPSEWLLRQTSYEFKKYPRTNGEVYCISGCQDNQTSADVFIESDKMYGGVLTSTMLSLLKSNDLKTYKWKHLLKDICCSEKVNGYTQRTALTSGNPLNMENTVFTFPVKNPVENPVKNPVENPVGKIKSFLKKYIPMRYQKNIHKNKNMMKKIPFM
jgi:hypothetical protein